MIVLFSPLGLAYGSLYSAILLVRPARVIVVSSRQAVVDLHSAVDAARFFHSNFEVETHLLDDPLAGFAEGRQLARQLAASAGTHNVINLTGGTTALQDCVRSVADILRAQTESNQHNANAPDANAPDVSVPDVSVHDLNAPHSGASHSGALHSGMPQFEAPHPIKVREVAVVDRRTPEEQKRVPLVVGELVEVPPL